MTNDPNFDKVNVRRLFAAVRKSVDAALKNNVFEDNIPQTKKTLEQHLASLKDYKVVCDFQVKDVYQTETTWEMLYPNMPHRLHAIAAAELYGSTLHEAPPAHVADIYTYDPIYVWIYPDGARDYRGDTNSGSYDRERDLEQKPIDVIEECVKMWTMRVPGVYLGADILYRPNKPVETISLSAVITRKGVSFGEAILEV